MTTMPKYPITPAKQAQAATKHLPLALREGWGEGIHRLVTKAVAGFVEILGAAIGRNRRVLTSVMWTSEPPSIWHPVTDTTVIPAFAGMTALGWGHNRYGTNIRAAETIVAEEFHIAHILRNRGDMIDRSHAPTWKRAMHPLLGTTTVQKIK